MILGGFGVVWGVILGAKGRPKWLQNLIKKMSDFLDRSWKRSGAPKGGLTILRGDGKSPRGGVRGGVNPPLREGVKNYIYNFAKLVR